VDHESVIAPRALVDRKIIDHQGRVVKNTGDGVLAEFRSVADAARCAACGGVRRRDHATDRGMMVASRIAI